MSEIISETMREITPSLDDGRYTIISAIREGRLYLTEKAGKHFVLKTSDGSAKGLELLKREYGLSLRIQHPFIASSVGWEEQTPVGPAIAIEYVKGRTLAEYLKESPSVKARQRLFGQLLDAVAAIHRQSVIHNDLKPENIIITDADNDVKLIDFGFADADLYYSDKGLGGTRSYASPELLSHGSIDARSDIYSLGRIMCDIFHGRYESISGKCLQANPAKRYPNVDALKKAWEHRNRRTVWIAAVLAIFLLAGLGILFNQAFNRGANIVAEGPENELSEIWKDVYEKVEAELAEAGFREFLPVHVEYGFYETEPRVREIISQFSDENAVALKELNSTLYMEYSQRLYDRFKDLPSLYDETLNISKEERAFYQDLAAHFHKYSPFRK